MKKDGFTLIEIIGVVIIITIIAVFAFPPLLKHIKDTKNELSDAVKQMIYSASELYASNHNLKKVDGYTYCVTINELMEGEYLHSNLIDPVTNKNVDPNKYIEIKVFNSSYEYNVQDDCNPYYGYYIDGSGANKPELYDKMIPVKYEDDNWIYADINEKWYDYDNKEWANAVVLNDGVTKSVGDTIDIETDVALMFVWIPRYKYTIFNGNNESVPEQEIKISFENGTNTTGTVTCNDALNQTDSSDNLISEICTDNSNGSIINGTSTYTHPAFCFGHRINGICDGEELTGFWVGKFENSTTDETCKTNPVFETCDKVLPVTIKPNVRSWRYTQVANFYTSIGNISNNYEMNVDSHMMKNMEWGAVAYLTQSKYGRCDNGTCTEIAKNDSSDYYTGRSLGRPSSASGEYSQSGTYTYEQPLGWLASTTGNIYGIYDMSGGSLDYVMGNMVNSSNQFYSSSGGFSTNPITKYYDSYTYDESYITHSRGKLGDATKETLRMYGNVSGGWYDDHAYFPCSANAWFIRGGRYGDDAYAGVFYFLSSVGNAGSSRAARSIIVAVE